MTFRRILKGALIVCASMAMPVGAHAKDDGARALERLAACTADHPKWRIKVEEFLVLSHFDPAYFPLMKELALNEECDKHFNGMIHFSPSAFRDTLYTAWAKASPDTEKLTASQMQMFADCLVGSETESARAFIASSEGDVAESEALAPLASAMPHCLVEGATLELTKTSLRAVLTSTLTLSSAADRQQELKANDDA